MKYNYQYILITRLFDQVDPAVCIVQHNIVSASSQSAAETVCLRLSANCLL